MAEDSGETMTGEEKRQSLRNFLKMRAEAGERYFKSRVMALELSLTPHEIGSNIGILAKEDSELVIEPYSRSQGGTIWFVEPSEK